MKANKTQGLCAYCSELNPYTAIGCSRCHYRLPWGFLNDGRTGYEEEKDSLFDRIAARLGRKAAKAPPEDICCRYCAKPIRYDEQICPHCDQWLVTGGHILGITTQYVDPEAPEIKRLLENYKRQRTLG
jgi:hypothetical protein